MTPLIMNIGQDLIRHAVSPKRRLQPVPTGRAVARTINAAETQNLEWSSIPLSMCNSARICQEEPAHQIHLPQLRSPRPLPALVIVPSATASGHLDQPVTHQAAIDRRPARQRLDRRRRQSGQDQPHQRSGRIFTLTFGGCSAERSGRVFCSQTMSTAKYYIFDRYASVLAALNSSWSARSAIMRPCARNVASRTHYVEARGRCRGSAKVVRGSPHTICVRASVWLLRNICVRWLRPSPGGFVFGPQGPFVFGP